jgi:hypothetical protein
LIGTMMPMAAPMLPLSARVFIPSAAARYSAGRTCFAGSGDVMGRSGFGGADAFGIAGRACEDLHVAAVPVVFAGVPEIVARLGLPARTDRGEQRPVQAHKLPALFLAVCRDVVQIRDMNGDHVERFVQIAVRRRC